MIGRPDAPHCDSHEAVCHICGDEAVAGRIVEIDAASRTAIVAFGDGGDAATVALDLVDVIVGDRVLVHLGFAIERLAEEVV